MADLTSGGKKGEARLIQEMVRTPQAVWFTGGTAKRVRQEVKATVKRAAGKKSVPVLVAYNIPFRDCEQYSAGGATSIRNYESWINGFAAGIGKEKAIVILEPDSLGIIPWYTNISGQLGWCQPAQADPLTAASERFQMLNYAVDTLKSHQNVKVYLDGTHSAWLSVGDIADRLIKAGVEKADGFFLNVSNYQLTSHELEYGTWVSDCIQLIEHSSLQPGQCPSQYYPASPDDFSTWSKTDTAYTRLFADKGVKQDPSAQAHFIIDTSRNGQGPWTPSSGTSYPDPQVWCNPPHRGLGPRPTTDTGNPLADAFLWIKIPGESDGSCTRGLTDNGGVDPVWGQVDPTAGAWFSKMALELANNANPPLASSKASIRAHRGKWRSQESRTARHTLNSRLSDRGQEE
ncbi:glycoside hydrolase family 6 protein [Rubrobacter naiadicus]|uniref:glycoside hydrolase family 6 protein n=1 Tax=Rubrobacter naiadicus TaxID=1392641 RepID=UPI0030811CA2